MKNHVFEFSLQKTQDKTNEVLQVTDIMTKEVTKEIVHRQMNNIQNDAPYREQFIKTLKELSIKFTTLQHLHSKFFSKLLRNLNKAGSRTSRKGDSWPRTISPRVLSSNDGVRKKKHQGRACRR